MPIRVRRCRLLQAAVTTVASALVSSAFAAPTVTYILSPNDDGQGNTVPGSFAIYATDSTADGNGGISAYTVDIQGYSSVFNLGPEAIYDDGTGSGGTVSAGFTFVRSGPNVDPIKASQDNFTPNRSRVQVIYGFGQTAGNLDLTAPAGSTGSSNRVQVVFDARPLIATGTFTNGAALSFVAGSLSDKSNVFTSNGALTTTAATVLTVTAQTDTYIGPTGSWSSAANWSPSIPGLGDTALLTGGSDNVVVTYDASATPVSLNRLTIDATAGGTRTLLQTAGTYAVSHEFVGVSGVGTLSISGGTHNVTSTGTNGLAVGINAGSTGAINLSGGSLNVSGVLALGVAGSATLTQSGGSLTAGSTVNNGSYVQNGGLASIGAVTGAGSMSVGGGGTAAQTSVNNFAQSSVNIGDQGSLIVMPNASVKFTNTAGALSIAGSGQLNLANHDLLTSTAAPTIRQYLINGYNGGSWNGTGGITSSSAAADTNHVRALGYATGGDPTAPASLGLSAGQTLVRSTLYGDADLSGRVTIADFNILSANFRKNPGNAVWDQGDFDYNGSVTIADFNRLSANYQKSVPVGSPNVAKGAALAATTLTASPAVGAPPAIEFDIAPNTGHVFLVANNIAITSYDIESSANNGNGDLVRAAWQKIAGMGGTLSANDQAYELDQEAPTGSTVTLNGTYDLGQILPLGLSYQEYIADIGDPLNPSTYGLPTGETIPAGVNLILPEPTCLGAGALVGAGLLCRKRRDRRGRGT